MVDAAIVRPVRERKTSSGRPALLVFSASLEYQLWRWFLGDPEEIVILYPAVQLFVCKRRSIVSSTCKEFTVASLPSLPTLLVPLTLRCKETS